MNEIFGGYNPQNQYLQNPMPFNRQQNNQISVVTVQREAAARMYPVAVRNTSEQPILVQNANIIFGRPDLAITR